MLIANNKLKIISDKSQNTTATQTVGPPVVLSDVKAWGDWGFEAVA